MQPRRHNTVGAASQWWSSERMMVYCKLMMVKCSLMMVKCWSMMVKWVYDILISPSFAWCKPSFAHVTIIEKLHQLQYVYWDFSFHDYTRSFIWLRWIKIHFLQDTLYLYIGWKQLSHSFRSFVILMEYLLLDLQWIPLNLTEV